MPPSSIAHIGPDSLLEIEPLKPAKLGWQRLLSWALSFGLFVAILWKLDVEGVVHALALVPEKPVFWLVFLTFYFALPYFDWIIFRKIWSLPLAAFPVLIQKRISNEMLLNYSGELYFYLWAREKKQFANAPFAVIKDVNVTSALANNVVTLVMLALLWPFIGHIDPAFSSPTFFLSAIGLVLISSAVILLRRWVFSLGWDKLFFMMRVHFVRIVLSTVLLALLWHLTLPQVPLIWWFALAAAKLFISRLPLIPNVELLFVTLAVFLISDQEQIGQLMVMIAALVSVTHLLMFGATFLLRLSLPDHNFNSERNE